jgi:hypothetical protein
MGWTSYVQIDNDELRFGLKEGAVYCWGKDGNYGEVIFDHYELSILNRIGIRWVDSNGHKAGSTYVNANGSRDGRETWSKKV